MGHAHRDRGRTRSARRTRIIYTVATIVGVAFLLGLPLGTAAIGGTALQLNGSSQYATLGASSDLQSPTFTLELWFKRTGAGVGTTTGTGGIASAIPLITKGTAEGETAAADINYFFGIDASSGKLVADFEEGCSAARPAASEPSDRRHDADPSADRGTTPPRPTTARLGTSISTARLPRRWRSDSPPTRHDVTRGGRHLPEDGRHGPRLLCGGRRRGADLELGALLGADPGEQGYGDHHSADWSARCLELERWHRQQPCRRLRQLEDRRRRRRTHMGGRLRPRRIALLSRRPTVIRRRRTRRRWLRRVCWQRHRR